MNLRVSGSVLPAMTMLSQAFAPAPGLSVRPQEVHHGDHLIRCLADTIFAGVPSAPAPPPPPLRAPTPSSPWDVAPPAAAEQPRRRPTGAGVGMPSAGLFCPQCIAGESCAFHGPGSPGPSSPDNTPAAAAPVVAASIFTHAATLVATAAPTALAAWGIVPSSTWQGAEVVPTWQGAVSPSTWQGAEVAAKLMAFGGVPRGHNGGMLYWGGA